MKVKPLPHGDVVIVELDPFPGSPGGPEDFYGTGIIRPEIAEERPIWGTVRGVGGARTVILGGKQRTLRTTVRPGQRVLVPYCQGQEFQPSGPGGEGPPCIAIHEYGPTGTGEGGLLAVEE